MTPGRGFRWVRVGWMLKKGDEHPSLFRPGWEKTRGAGEKLTLSLNKLCGPYRRHTATRKTKGRA